MSTPARVHTPPDQARVVATVTTLVGLALTAVGFWWWVPFAGSTVEPVATPVTRLLAEGPPRGGYVTLTEFRPDPAAAVVRPHSKGRMVTYFVPLRSPDDIPGAVFVPVVREPGATTDQLRAELPRATGMLQPADDLSRLEGAFPSADLARSWVLDPARSPADGRVPLVMLVLGVGAFGFGVYGLAFVRRAERPPEVGRLLFRLGGVLPLDHFGRWLTGLPAPWRLGAAMVLGIAGVSGLGFGVWAVTIPSPTSGVDQIHLWALATALAAAVAVPCALHLVSPRTFGRLLVGSGAFGADGN